MEENKTKKYKIWVLILSAIGLSGLFSIWVIDFMKPGLLHSATRSIIQVVSLAVIFIPPIVRYYQDKESLKKYYSLKIFIILVVVSILLGTFVVAPLVLFFQ